MSLAEHQKNRAISTVAEPVPAPDGTRLLADYLLPEELAAELGICERTLSRWDSLRIGPPRVTIGRKVRYRRLAVQEWLLKRERGLSDPKGTRSRRTAGRR